MRFRKSIKLMKGVKLNFSQSGVSLTAGVRGASVNFGPRGTYLNTGIPGTGLYERKRLDTDEITQQASSDQKIRLAITVGIEDDGTYFIKDQAGNLITDESILRKIKRTEAYKAKIQELSESFASEKIEENEAFINIHKLSPKLISESDVRKELETLQPLQYQKRLFEEPAPNKDEIELGLMVEASQKIRSLLFWTLKKRRADYVASKLPSAFENASNLFIQRRDEFTLLELETEKTKNKEFLVEYNSRRSEMLSFLEGDQNWVEQRIDSFLGYMTLPVSFSVAYEYNSEKGQLSVDLDLPEIEDLPNTKVATLSTGKVKVKEKSQKELREEYVRCVSGLAFFFSCCFFNISSRISSIQISGYTQRLNKKTGKVADDYVYSIVFSRTGVAELSIENIDPIVAFDGFPNRRAISKSWELSSITPFSDFED